MQLLSQVCKKKTKKTKETQHKKARKILQRADNTFWAQKFLIDESFCLTT